MKITQLSNKQSGLAMLTVTLLLLISATSFTFFSVKSRLMESKIAANDYRYREAFINAEAGMDYAFSLMNSKGWKEASALPSTDLGSGRKLYTVTDANRYTVEIEEMCVDCSTVRVTSKGKGDSGNNTKTISRIADARYGVKTIDSPLLAAGSSTVVGSININGEYNHSPVYADHAIQTGGPIFNQSGASVALYPAGSDKTGVDSLRGDNFLAYMGVPEKDWTDVRDSDEVAVIADCNETTIDTALALIPKPVALWVEGDCVLTADVGADGDPTTLIVQDGSLSGVANIYGLLYAFDSTNVTGGSAAGVSQASFAFDLNGQINGAAIFDYKYTFGYQNTLHIVYRSDYLTSRLNGDAASAYWVPGGWSDFDA